MKIYSGTPDGYVTVEDQSGQERRLPLGPSLLVRNHSPSGFSWGYNGSGPSQLALALLLDHCRTTEKATKLYQLFKEQVIAKLDIDKPWRLTSQDIEAAIRRIQGSFTSE
jgi:hypothetical protein